MRGSDLIAQGFHVSPDFNLLNCPVRTPHAGWCGWVSPATIWRSVLLRGQEPRVLQLFAVLNAILTFLSMYFGPNPWYLVPLIPNAFFSASEAQFNECVTLDMFMENASISSLSFECVQPDETGKIRRVVVASSLGNALEIYDFTVYSFFAVIIGQLFFPADSSLASLMMSLLTFAMGFLIRPLGAVFIGRFADRYGRKQALTLSIALMTAGTGIIAFTPTYSSIGSFATALLVLGRLLQGFSAGGEVGAASAFLMESGRTDNRCFMVCWQGASQGAAALLGALSGLLLTTMLSEQALYSWGWRVPFILGLLIGPVGWYIRKYLAETHENRDSPTLFRDFMCRHIRTLGLGILLMASSTVSFYMVVFYMPTYLIRTLHYPSSLAFSWWRLPAYCSLLSRLWLRGSLTVCHGVNRCCIGCLVGRWG